MAKVSVIIPTYNCAQYVVEAIESVLNQTYKDFEIIVIDDGSTDNTQEVLLPYIEGNKIKYLYQTHSGRPSVARNRGLKNSSAEYICFLDSDDMLVKESVYERVDILNSYNDVGVVFSNWLKFKNNFSPRKLETTEIIKNKFLEKLPTQMIDSKSKDYYIFKREFVYEIFNSSSLKTSTVMMRMSLLNRIGMFDESLIIGEDYDLFLRLGVVTNLAFIVKPLSYSRGHGNNIASDSTRNIIEDTKVIEKFVSNNRKMSNQIKKRFYKKLERFYLETGLYFLDQDDCLEARKRLFRAVKYNPLSFESILYYVFTFLPIKKDTIIYAMLRWLKRKFSKLIN